MLIVFIQDGERLPGWGSLDEMAQAAFSDQSSTALPVANEVNDIHARLAERGEVELSLDSTQWRIVILIGLFGVRHQPVQVDVGIDFLPCLPVEILRVDLKDFHDQRRDVLDV